MSAASMHGPHGGHFHDEIVTMFSSHRRRAAWRKHVCQWKGTVLWWNCRSLVIEDELHDENMSASEKERFCDEIAWFVTVRQMWRAFYDDFRIVINSSQKVFNDEFGLFHGESVVIDMNFWTSGRELRAAADLRGRRGWREEVATGAERGNGKGSQLRVGAKGGNNCCWAGVRVGVGWVLYC
jgi:hypothetical protein